MTTDTLPIQFRFTLECIESFISGHGYSPSLREVAHMAGLASTSVAAYHVKVLAEAGLIRVAPGVARSIQLPVFAARKGAEG